MTVNGLARGGRWRGAWPTGAPSDSWPASGRRGPGEHSIHTVDSYRQEPWKAPEQIRRDWKPVLLGLPHQLANALIPPLMDIIIMTIK
jgi:hypothetical protein